MGGMIFFRSTVLEAIEYQNGHKEEEKITEVKKLQIISTTEWLELSIRGHHVGVFFVI